MKHFLLLFVMIQFSFSQVIMGYMFDGYTPSKEQFSKMTHIGISFLRASDTTGSIEMTKGWENLDEIVALAHKSNTKALISFGGGEYKITKALVGSPKNRANLVKNIVAFVKKHKLDGVDMDWEPSWLDDKAEMEEVNMAINEHFLDVIKELREALDKEFGKGGKIFSAAVLNQNAVWYNETKQIAHFPQNGWWNYLDFVSLMNYDNDIGAKHATFESVFGEKGSIAYWTGFGIPEKKIMAGVPFYARAGWGPDAWLLYSDVIKQNPKIAGETDFIKHDNGKGQGMQDYGFNGVATVAKKVAAVKKRGLVGIMFWQLGGDLPATDSRSLLNVMHKTMGAK